MKACVLYRKYRKSFWEQTDYMCQTLLRSSTMKIGKITIELINVENIGDIQNNKICGAVRIKA